jgi:hypothetical protein
MKVLFIKVLVLLLMILIINGYAQKKITKPIKRQVAVGAAKCSFSEKEIDTNVAQLPPNYHGNDIKALTVEVVKKQRLVKDEFETTAQFQERVENEKKKKIVGELAFNSTFAFEDNGFIPFKYDADNKRMSVSENLGSRLYFSNVCQNVTGNSVNFLILKNDRLVTDYKFDWSINIAVEEAKILKSNLRILYLVKLNNLIGEYYTSPIIWMDSINRHRFNVIKIISERDVAEVWFNRAKREFSRNKELLEVGVVSRNDYDEANKELKNAETNLKNIEEKLKIAQTQLIPYINVMDVVSKDKPTINVLLKEIWIYDISTGKILVKHRTVGN